jgi:hypothetical protein
MQTYSSEIPSNKKKHVQMKMEINECITTQLALQFSLVCILLFLKNFVLCTPLIMADKRKGSIDIDGATREHSRMPVTLEMKAEIVKLNGGMETCNIYQKFN